MRITIPEHSVGVVMPVELAQNLYSLCATIRKTKRLRVDPAIHMVAGDVILAVLASEAFLVLAREFNNEQG